MITTFFFFVLGCIIVAVLFLDILAWTLLFILMSVGGVEIPTDADNSPLKKHPEWASRVVAISASFGSLLIRIPLLNKVSMYFF